MAEKRRLWGETAGVNGKDRLYDPRLASFNPEPEALIRGAIEAGESTALLGEGVLVVDTGKYTGRSPKDKFIVEDPEHQELLDGSNQIFPRADYERLLEQVREHLATREVFVQQVFAGADPDHRLAVEVVTRKNWHSLFARNLFIQRQNGQLENFQPAFRVVNVSDFQAIPERDGTRTETFILLDFQNKLILIGGTDYAGEIKKGIFTVMNHFLPLEGVMPMHCSCNYSADGRVSLFFGLSGTGKTTLSADPMRTLIGDDEHGWNGRGVFNFEGGCYAKVIGFDPEAEPEIAAAINGYGTILENVVLDENGIPDFNDASKTENTRAAYSSDVIAKMDRGGMAGHPQDIFFLSYDAFGVLPPISELTPDQAVEYFLAGYTAKTAGTERGVTEPQATFSACFGQPFLTHPPKVYAELLKQKIAQHKVRVHLINTGMTGGPYGTGKRMSIAHTRAIIRAAQDGKLAKVPRRMDPVFGFSVPIHCPGVPAQILDPKYTWPDPEAYDRQAAQLKQMFDDNAKRFV